MMQPAGRGSRRKRQPTDQQEALDPIALTLALWLGLVVSVSAMVKLANDAATDAAMAQAGGQVGAPDATGHAATDLSAFNPRLLAFGG